jgi:hypothetical protein
MQTAEMLFLRAVAGFSINEKIPGTCNKKITVTGIGKEIRRNHCC